MSNRRINKSETASDAQENVSVTPEVILEQEPTAVSETLEAQAVHDDAEPVQASEVGRIADAIRHGAASASAAVGEVIPGIGRVVRKSVYKTFYGVSYGVVFTALSVSRLLPSNSLVVEGLKDGALAARKAVEHEATASSEHDAVPA